MIRKSHVAPAALAAFCWIAPVQAATICLHIGDIDHTQVLDSRTILFHMKNKTVWRNTLRTPCPGLKFNGFAYRLNGTDELCSGAKAIHILRTHEICLLGDFTAEPAGENKTP